MSEIQKELLVIVKNTELRIPSLAYDIACTAASNWGGNKPETAEEAKGYLQASVDSTIAAILSILPENNIVVNSPLSSCVKSNTSMPDNTQKSISKSIEAAGVEKVVLETLDFVHDRWMVSNLKAFEKKMGQNKGRQFTPFYMLTWKEAKSDLLFATPIFESLGIQVDEASLEASFKKAQLQFFIDNGIAIKGKDGYAVSTENIASYLFRQDTEYDRTIKECGLPRDPETVKTIAIQTTNPTTGGLDLTEINKSLKTNTIR